MDAPSLSPRISLITLGVHDMALMRGFYERLGFTASSASNQDVTFFDAKGIVLGLYGYKALAEDAQVAAGPKSTFPGFSIAWNAMSESHVDEVVAHALKAGAVLVKQPQKVFWGGYSGYFKDPENNLWEAAYNPFFPFDAEGHINLP
jgi:uncharacterized protein